MDKVRSRTVGQHGWAKAQVDDVHMARPSTTSNTAPASFTPIMPSAPSELPGGAMGRSLSAFIALLGLVSRTPPQTKEDAMHEPPAILGQSCTAQPC